jgi:hypothetical protein
MGRFRGYKPRLRFSVWFLHRKNLYTCEERIVGRGWITMFSPSAQTPTPFTPIVAERETGHYPLPTTHYPLNQKEVHT